MIARRPFAPSRPPGPERSAFGAGWALLFVGFVVAASLLWTGIAEAKLWALQLAWGTSARWLWLGGIFAAAIVLPLLLPRPKATSRLRSFQTRSLLVLALALAGAVTLRFDSLVETCRAGVRASFALLAEPADPTAPAAGVQPVPDLRPAPENPPVVAVDAKPPAAAELISKSAWGSLDLRSAVDLPDGSLAVSGTFTETALFGSGADAQLRVATGGTDGFVALFGPDRRLRWVRLIHICPSAAVELKAAPDGAVLVTARIGVPSSVETGRGADLKIPLASKTDHAGYAVVERLEADGTLAWARWFSSEAGMGSGPGIEPLEDGDVLVWLNFNKYLREGPEEADAPLTTPAQTFQGTRTYLPAVALLRFRKDGSRAWGRTLASAEPLTAWMSAALPGSAAVMTGTVAHPPSEAAPPDAMYVAWISGKGDVDQLRFVRNLTAPASADPRQVVQLRPAGVAPGRIAAGPDGSVVVAVSVHGKVKIDDDRILEPTGKSELLLISFSRSRALRWATVSAGDGFEFSLAQQLEVRGDSVDLIGSVDYPFEFARGTPSARTFTPEAPRSFRASFGPDGALTRLDRIPTASRLPGVGCCTRTSLETERKRPSLAAPPAPAPASEASAWIDAVLPSGLELGWTKEDEVVLPGVTRQPTINKRDSVWMLAPATLPGGALKGVRMLESARGVAHALNLVVRDGEQGASLERVRSFFAPLERGTVNGRASHCLVDHYCNLPGRPGLQMLVSYREGRLTQVTLLGELAPVETPFQKPPQCFSPEEAKKWDALDLSLQPGAPNPLVK